MSCIATVPVVSAVATLQADAATEAATGWSYRRAIIGPAIRLRSSAPEPNTVLAALRLEPAGVIIASKRR